MTPEQAMPEIKEYTKDKVPYFFKYAKKYKEKDIANKVVKQYIDVPVQDEDGEVTIEKKLVHEYTPVVNMLEDIITTKNIHFRDVANKLEYKNLQSVQNFKVKNQALYDVIKKKYIAINKNKNKYIDKESVDYRDKETKYAYVAKTIKKEFMNEAKLINENVTDAEIADILVEYLYKVKKADNKNTLWECYGDILLANLKKNVLNVKKCEQCGEEFTPNHKKEKYCCGNCKKQAENVKNAERQARFKAKQQAV